MTPCAIMCHSPNCWGNPSSGRESGIASPRAKPYSRHACAMSTTLRIITGGLVKKLFLSGMPASIDSVDPVNEPMHDNQQHQGDDEEHPALRGVEEALREIGAIFADHPGEGHASRISGDRDGYGGRQQCPSHPLLVVEEICIYQRKKRKRKQRSDAAARLHHAETLAG